MAIHPRAIVSPKARIAADCEIGPFCIVHAGVEIGSGSRVGSHCELGITPERQTEEMPTRLTIGENATIRSHSVFYAGSSFGAGLVTGHRVTVREGIQAGARFQIGTLSELQGDSIFGDDVRMQSSVFVAQGSRIEDCVWLLPRVMLTNDPTPPSDTRLGCTVEAYAVVAAGALVLPGVRVGAHALVAAQACVTKDVPVSMVVAGVPATVVGPIARVMLRDASGRPAYPWTSHFHRGYPVEKVAAWMGAPMQTEQP